MEVGDRVRVKELAGVVHYRGIIRALNVDGTFDITRVDGVDERSVSADRIHRIGDAGEKAFSLPGQGNGCRADDLNMCIKPCLLE